MDRGTPCVWSKRPAWARGTRQRPLARVVKGVRGNASIALRSNLPAMTCRDVKRLAPRTAKKKARASRIEWAAVTTPRSGNPMPSAAPSVGRGMRASGGEQPSRNTQSYTSSWCVRNARRRNADAKRHRLIQQEDWCTPFRRFQILFETAIQRFRLRHNRRRSQGKKPIDDSRHPFDSAF